MTDTQNADGVPTGPTMLTSRFDMDDGHTSTATSAPAATAPCARP